MINHQYTVFQEYKEAAKDKFNKSINVLKEKFLPHSSALHKSFQPGDKGKASNVMREGIAVARDSVGLTKDTVGLAFFTVGKSVDLTASLVRHTSNFLSKTADGISWVVRGPLRVAKYGAMGWGGLAASQTAYDVATEKDNINITERFIVNVVNVPNNVVSGFKKADAEGSTQIYLDAAAIANFVYEDISERVADLYDQALENLGIDVGEEVTLQDEKDAIIEVLATDELDPEERQKLLERLEEVETLILMERFNVSPPETNSPQSSDDQHNHDGSMH